MIQDSHLIDHQDNGAKLIRMAQEIADYFHAYPPETASESIANHINHFWTPKMREDFLAAANEPGRVADPAAASRERRNQKKKMR